MMARSGRSKQHWRNPRDIFKATGMMTNTFRHFIRVFFVALFASGTAVAASPASNPKASDKIVDKFLDCQRGEYSTTELQGNAVVDLNGDQKPEIVRVWVKHTANSWRCMLTVLAKVPAGVVSVSRPLDDGYAKLGR